MIFFKYTKIRNILAFIRLLCSLSHFHSTSPSPWYSVASHLPPDWPDDLAATYLLSLLCPLTITKAEPFHCLHLLRILQLIYSLFSSSLHFHTSKNLPPSIKTQIKCCCLHENIPCIYSSHLYSIKNSPSTEVFYLYLYTLKILPDKLVYFCLYLSSTKKKTQSFKVFQN